MEGTGTTIEVTARFFPLAFMFFLMKPTVTIDETPPRVVSWRRTHRFDVGPGLHTVTVVVVNRGKGKIGENSIDLSVADGATTSVSYYAPLLIFLKGSLSAQA